MTADADRRPAISVVDETGIDEYENITIYNLNWFDRDIGLGRQGQDEAARGDHVIVAVVVHITDFHVGIELLDRHDVIIKVHPRANGLG